MIRRVGNLDSGTVLFLARYALVESRPTLFRFSSVRTLFEYRYCTCIRSSTNYRFRAKTAPVEPSSKSEFYLALFYFETGARELFREAFQRVLICFLRDILPMYSYALF